jgi:toxin ParE1/3/4
VSLRVEFTALADADIDQLALRIAQSNGTAARRFVEIIGWVVELVAEHSGAGTLVFRAPAELKGLRRYPIRGFRNHLLYYLADAERVLVVRVLHGARRQRSALLESRT